MKRAVKTITPMERPKATPDCLVDNRIGVAPMYCMTKFDTKPRYSRALENWTNLNSLLLYATVDDCTALRNIERGGKKRPSFLNRIDQRERVAKKIARLRKRA